MEYKFKKDITKAPIGSNMDPFIEYGVDRESLSDDMKSLFHIGWHGWTSKNIQELIDKTQAIQGEEYFDYYVEDSELRICVDNEYVLFFDWRTDTEEDDFRITTTEFISFLQDFKTFVEENS